MGGLNPGGIGGIPGIIGGLNPGGIGGLTPCIAGGGGIYDTGAADRGGAGPPTPLTGPAKPVGIPPIGMPLPAALPIPGPSSADAGMRLLLSPEGGGPLSTLMETIVSPRRIISPSVRFCSVKPFFPFDTLISSQSARTTFMCLSKAMNCPIIVLPSVRVIFNL